MTKNVMVIVVESYTSIVACFYGMEATNIARLYFGITCICQALFRFTHESKSMPIMKRLSILNAMKGAIIFWGLLIHVIYLM